MHVPQAHDITRSLVTGKAGEGMIAFAGLRLSGSDGVLKIAAFERPDHSGYFTLTFLIDLGESESSRLALEGAFHKVDQNGLEAWMGDDLQMLVAMSLDGFANAGQYFIHELNLYVQNLSGRERFLLEERILPALEQLLQCEFQPLEWLEDMDAPGHAGLSDDAMSAPVSLGQHVRLWLQSLGKR